MPTRATELRYVRRVLDEIAPDFLKLSGMDFYNDQFFYKYTEESIFFAEIGLKGGLPDQFWKSLTCTMHIYYRDYPGYKNPPIHESGNMIPTYRQSRLSFGMDRQLNQEREVEDSGNPSLKYHKDFWFIIEDESNIKEAFYDMAGVIKNVGLPMVSKEQYSRAEMIKKA